LVALVVMLAPAPVRRALELGYATVARRAPSLIRITNKPAVRTTLLAVATLAAIITFVSLIYGPVRIASGRTVLFKSSGVVRPLIVVVLFGTLAAAVARTSRVAVMLLALSVLPWPFYRDMWTRMAADEHPLRAASECLTRVES